MGLNVKSYKCENSDFNILTKTVLRRCFLAKKMSGFLKAKYYVDFLVKALPMSFFQGESTYQNFKIVKMKFATIPVILLALKVGVFPNYHFEIQASINNASRTAGTSNAFFFLNRD